MSFKRIATVDIYETFRRWHVGHSIRQISRSLGYDRKTIRKHLNLITRVGFSRQNPLPSRKDFTEKLDQFRTPRHTRKATAQEKLLPFADELKNLIEHPSNPLKPKIAFELIQEKYDFSAQLSYSSFKRFVHSHKLAERQTQSTCRIEVPPGNQVQIDYAYMGRLFDVLTQKIRKVYAFIASLAFSRHKFVQFVFSMNQASFIASHLAMFDFFDGVPLILKIDNLKNGVLKTDIYDPQLNRAYAEMAEYYHCFIEPCRVAHPKDKPKVERDVQTIRDQFRKLLALHPNLDLPKANRQILLWLKDTYGQREHGSTHHKPWDDFMQFEKSALRSLPSEPFQIPEWKEAKVHPDHYVQFNKKTFSAPHNYVGESVWLRASGNILQIFHQSKLIKQHLITEQYRHTDLADFPENVRQALDQGLPLKIQNLARSICPDLQELIRQILSPHCFLNLRKAQAILSLAKQYHDPALIKQACEYIQQNQIHITYQNFKRLLSQLKNQSPMDDSLPLSEQTQEFVRNIQYFVKNN